MTTTENLAGARQLPAGATVNTVKPTGCCPPFDPSGWDDREMIWKEKPFVTDRVHSFLHVPIDMARKLRFNRELIDAAQAGSAGLLTLADENSLWGADIFIEVTGPVPGARMTSLSGTFRTKVYEGPFSKVVDWAADMRAAVAKTGRRVAKIYFAYTTCPRCAKAYGKNYVVLFAKLTDVSTVAG
jgi:hypothetical protein